LSRAAVTIRHVAEAAGVSIKTVSRVMNREAAVNEETRERVLAAAEALHYAPNRSARSLAGSRSFLIALLFDNPSSNYIADLQRGAVARCREDNYHLVVEPLDSTAEEADCLVRDLVATLRPDGLIVTPPVSDHRGVLDRLDAAGVRYVRIAPMADLGRAPRVYMDDERAAFEMTRRLLDFGHRRIGFVSGPERHAASGLRRTGYARAMRAAGLDPETHVRPGRYDFRSGFEAGQALLIEDERPTAVFAANDDMALGVTAAAHRLGLEIPRDVSVAGFDDTPAAQSVWPRLSTVRQPISDMAAAAVELLLHEEERGERLLPFEIVMRESTGPAG
jgi:LacI family transcriptional regulator